jgi:hypothetical protein
VFAYYYAKDAELAMAQSVDELQDIVWDFSPFESTDPQVTLEEVLI